MATSSKGPSNDFAPAWLKIPAQPNKDGEKQKGGSGRHGDGGYYSGQRGIQRQRSFDARYNDPRPNSNKYHRHHSLDGYYDDYYYGYYDDYYGYQAYPPYPHPYNGGNKYQHPNSRPGHDAFSYYPYGYPYDHNFVDPPYFVNSRHHFNHEGLKNERNSSDRHRRNSKDSFNSEFPTLGNGSSSKSSGSPAKTSKAGAWDKPNNKVLSQPKSNSPVDTSNPTSESSKPSTTIYKAAVSSKGISTRKPLTNDSPDTLEGGDLTKCDNKPAIQNGVTDSNSNKINGFNHPDDESTQGMVNGVANLHLNASPSHQKHEDVFLSSSLEAEQRLLKEMGWNESDEDEYEITEDDLREFQNLSKQVKGQCIASTKNTPVDWPGKKGAPMNPVADLNELGFEMSEESDQDSN